jgi:predicted transcriptional regulator
MVRRYSDKKIFSFYLRDDLKEKMLKICEGNGSTLTHQINRAIDFQLERDKKIEEGVRENERLYGPSNPPEDVVASDVAQLIK